jgi:hypothetical protein
MSDRASPDRDRTSGRQRWAVGFVAAPGLAGDLAQELVDRLPELMRERVPDVDWGFVVRTEPLAAAAGAEVDLVQLCRERMLAEGWQFAICLTDLPLRVGRQPVTAYASVSLGVGVVSVPALGAVDISGRVLQAVLRLMERLLGASGRGGDSGGREPGELGKRALARLRVSELRELSSPVGLPEVSDRETVRFVAPGAPGNLRLLVGMVRANRPWRLILGLSRALVAALGIAAFALTSPPIWRISDAVSLPRMLAIAGGSLTAIGVTLIAGHRLWERSPSPAVRERVRLINLATTVTVALGVVTLFVALLAVTSVCDLVLLVPRVLRKDLGHEPALATYLRIAWVVSSLATIGGALGAALESDVTVRERAYGYRADGNSGHGDDGG